MIPRNCLIVIIPNLSLITCRNIKLLSWTKVIKHAKFYVGIVLFLFIAVTSAECMHHNSMPKLKITTARKMSAFLCMIKYKYICDVRHDLYPSSVTSCHIFLDHLPLLGV